MIKKRDTVKIIPTGKFGIIMDIQYERNRYQLHGVSNWQLGIENIEKQDTKSLLTLIDQQAVKIANYERHANEFIYGESEEGSTHFEKMEASLNLAVKALEEIRRTNVEGSPVKTYQRMEQIADSTLDQIRGTET